MSEGIRETIKMTVEGHVRHVDLQDYITAKHKTLQGFGYTNLTRDEVEKQARAVLNCGELNVIGMFMENEIKWEG